MVMLFSVETQESVDVPRDQVRQALDSKAFLPLREMKITEPSTGTTVSVPGALYRNALELDFQPWEKSDEYKGSAYGAAALAAGAASGISFGLSDLILEKGLDVDVGNLRKAQEEMFMMGEVGGIVGSLFIPGGAVAAGAKLTKGAKAFQIARGVTVAPRAVASFGGRTAKATEGLALKWLAGATTAAEAEAAGVLTKAAAKAAGLGVGGTLEGTAYGIGQGISDIAFSEKALGDNEAIGEALTAHIGPTALWLGGAGAGFGGLASLTGSAFKGLTKRIVGRLEEAAGKNRVGLTAFAEEHTLKALGMTAAGAKKFRKSKPDIFKTLQDEGLIVPGASTEELIKGVASNVEKHGTLIGLHQEGFDNFIQGVAPQAMERLAAITKQTKSLRRQMAKKLKKGVTKAALAPQREQLRVLTREAATIANKHVHAPWMPTVIQRLKNKLKRPPAGVAPTFDIGRFWQEVDKAARGAIQGFTRNFRGDLALTFQEAHSIKVKFGQLGYKFGKSINPADKSMAAGFRAIEQEMRREIQRARTALTKKNPSLAGSLESLKNSEKVFGDLNNLAEQLDGSVFTKNVEQTLASMVSTFLRVGSYRLMFGKFGVFPLLAAGGVTSATGIGHAITKGTPHATIAHRAYQLTKLREVQKIAEGVQGRVDNVVNGFFQNLTRVEAPVASATVKRGALRRMLSFAAKPITVPYKNAGKLRALAAPTVAIANANVQEQQKQADFYKQLFSNAAALLNDPNELMTRVSASLYQLEDVAQVTSGYAAGTAARAVQAITEAGKANLVAAPTATVDPLMDAEVYLPPVQNLMRFADIASAVLDPLTIMEVGFNSGTLASWEAAAINFVYPKLHSYITAQIAFEIGELPGPLQQRQKDVLARWVGAPTSRLTTAGFLARAQVVYNQEQAVAPDTGAPVRSSSDRARRIGRGARQAGEAAQTQPQRIAVL
jgi:hypothetical protein